jgi:hypothetical protein
MLLKEKKKESYKLLEDEEENVNSYWLNLRNREVTGN